MSSHKDFASQAPGAEGVDPNHPAAAHLPIIDADAGRIGWFATGRKKIALCGFASSSRHRIPVNDPEWVIVGLNQLYRHIPRADVWFDIHMNWREDNVEGTDHPRWLAQCGIPVVMVHRETEVPTGVKNPKVTLDAHFDSPYATSTVAHMLRLFIYEIDMDVARRLKETPSDGPATARGLATAHDVYLLARSMYQEYSIGIFGIDLIVGTEYEFQRQCAEFWIGEAEGRGINLAIPPESALLKQLWCYGYQKEPAGWPFQLSELDQRKADLNKQKDTVLGQMRHGERMLATIDGALQEQEMLGTIAALRVRGGTIAIPSAG